MPKILVIEDCEAIRENLIDILEEEGYDVLAAANGKIGLQLLNSLEQVPDLIVCDVLMPELNGYQVATAIRENPTTNLIRFIFLTAKAGQDDIRKGMAIADDYLLKPFNRKDLLKTVAAQLRRGQTVGEILRNKQQRLVTEMLQATRKKVESEFVDKIGNLIGNIWGCLVLLGESDTPAETKKSQEDGLRATAELFAIYEAYLQELSEQGKKS